MNYPDGYLAANNPHLYTAADLAQSEREAAWFAFTDALGLLLDAAHDVKRDRLPETRDSEKLLEMVDAIAARLERVA